MLTTDSEAETAVGRRVSKAFEELLRNDPGEALFEICAAIEGTARREGLPHGHGYKQFVGNNLPIISGIAFGPALSGLRVRYSHPELPATSDGIATLEDIVYHVFRCGLYHTGKLPDDIEFTDHTVGAKNGVLFIPKMVVAGLIVAVVASPANAGGRTSPSYFFERSGKRYVLNNLWGRREQLLVDLKEQVRGSQQP